ncbi:rubrerythrin family protein [Sulfolobus acidocaldarius]|uniref:Rubrerythrin n=5 Tax=Sulfolobus acidocaldarius TaxID=2285 RepID=Q4J6M4_SULAC|nr:rubrerythrin family protein [Sulfolobus acidocaldarius]AHC52296.1 rubrerythrin [Sulfolobus acidocaldarius SUSAZ]AAY81558.1 rubrerythrin [Sulfolobus acidocaldarius DSM 639]AGE72161.1 rubrerythrin [Sulfolobus acidocaldarius N8]AGE74478.1 rubrerythrin [Sulfolobus acidocaldarius Ron12/I]ALU29667.1 rubrerythrin [Sulfolobus acidocaldarius]
MADIKNSKTAENLRHAFMGEAMANRRYLFFAKTADEEGYPELAQLMRSIAEGETAHAFGHLDYIKQGGIGDPATDKPIRTLEEMLQSAIAGETYEWTQMYPGYAKQAREEGFEDVAEWFETLARAEKSHAEKFTKALELLKGGK